MNAGQQQQQGGLFEAAVAAAMIRLSGLVGACDCPLAMPFFCCLHAGQGSRKSGTTGIHLAGPSHCRSTLGVDLMLEGVTCAIHPGEPSLWVLYLRPLAGCEGDVTSTWVEQGCTVATSGPAVCFCVRSVRSAWGALSMSRHSSSSPSCGCES